MSCSGKCCSVFNYTITPEQLRERAQGEDLFLADMLVSLTPEEAQERALRFEVDLPEGYTLEQWIDFGPLYTCRHWDEDTKLCTVYEQRPTMCREYPYDKACQHDKCCTYRPSAEVQARWAEIHARQEA